MGTIEHQINQGQGGDRVLNVRKQVSDGRSARKGRTQARVLTAAAQLFADKGFSGTSVDDVAREARVAKGSIFYNFGSKDALCRAVVEGGVDQLVSAVVDARQDRSGWEALEAAALALLESVDQDPDRCQVLTTELFRRERPWQDQLPQLRARLVTPIADIMAEVHAERMASGRFSELKPEPDTFEMVAISFVGALLFSALDRRAFCPERSLTSLHKTLMVTVSGLRA